MSRLNGKVAVITGGNSGIGLASAQQFAAEGAKVVIFGRNQQTLDSALETLPAGSLGVQGDVANLDDIDKLIAATVEQHGNIDVLFVNAGVAGGGPIEKMTSESYDKLMNINVKGAYFTIQKALPYLNEGSSVILTSSAAATKGLATMSVYGATKAALNSFARSLSAELLPRKIRVNVISPGPVETPIFTRNGQTQAQVDGTYDYMKSMIPMGRIGQADEVAKAVAFLASDDSSFIAGEDIAVDGGMARI